MPRYLVERTFAGGWDWTTVTGTSAPEGVIWVHSYVTPDRLRSFCIVESPSPQAVRVAGVRTGLPVDRITEVRVLFPHFFL